MSVNKPRSRTRARGVIILVGMLTIAAGVSYWALGKNKTTEASVVKAKVERVAAKDIAHVPAADDHHRAVRFHGQGPACLGKPLDLRAAGMGGQKAGSPGLFGAQEQEMFAR